MFSRAVIFLSVPHFALIHFIIIAEKDVMPEMKRAWSVCKGGKMEMLALSI